jgi:hypothetical protein
LSEWRRLAIDIPSDIAPAFFCHFVRFLPQLNLPQRLRTGALVRQA